MMVSYFNLVERMVLPFLTRWRYAGVLEGGAGTVSYTHLTLPTILLV